MTYTSIAFVADKIEQIKTITEEKWNVTNRQVTILGTSWNPFRILMMREGEILASLRSTKWLMGQMENELPDLPYLIETGTELLKIDECTRWMVAEVYKHFT
jgi:hypothetical protein